MKFNALVLLPVLLLSLALLPASRGELSLLKTEAAAAQRKVASLMTRPEAGATERPVMMAKAVPGRRSAKEFKAQRRA